MAKNLREVTREEWFSCQYAGVMMRWLQTADGRKLRLLACACCREIWDLLPEDARRLVEAAEQWADRHITRTEMVAIREEVEPRLAQEMVGFLLWARTAVLATATPAKEALRHLLRDVAVARAGHFDGEGVAAAHERHLLLIHDVFDGLFLDPTLREGWKTPEVLRGARAIYQGQDFDEMPLLGDALEEAGCTNVDVLEHCRGPGPHVRGCWVVDLLLGEKGGGRR